MIMNNKEAVIVVDYQNDFAHPKWSLYVKGWESIVWYINTLMQEIQQKSGLIITSQDWHPEDHISFAKTFNISQYSQLNWETKWPDHCVMWTWWADFLKEFRQDLVDKKVLKWTQKESDSYSSFGWIEKETGKNLDEILKNYNIAILHIVWLATEYCDLATAKDAIKLWYEVIVHQRWISAVNMNPRDWEKAIEEMKKLWAKILS